LQKPDSAQAFAVSFPFFILRKCTVEIKEGVLIPSGLLFGIVKNKRDGEHITPIVREKPYPNKKAPPAKRIPC
jgi:hypothetical protein